MEPDTPPTPSAGLRIAGAIGVALIVALGAYLMLEATQPDSGLVSFSFLLLLPAGISAFAGYVSDPLATRSLSHYMKVSLYLYGAAMLLSAVVLREGVICVLMLTPLWLGSGCIGAVIAYRLRRRGDAGNRLHSAALLVVPLLAMQIEPAIPLPTDHATVERSAVIAASPETLWPLLRGVPDVRPGEGRWNVSQDIFGIPRPIGATLSRDGIGGERIGVWEYGIRFRERIIDWQPGRRIGWRFVFDDSDGWDFTDRHLRPDSRYFRVTTGGYRMTPLGDGRTLLTVHTSYRITTPVNAYSRLWGELFLGDLENNLLGILRQRAER
ncbi:SRPBCC family protein [Sphingomonas sp. Leaf25]|uniref:SRPBCC family protein n=1 Tax=Sphingomonas sp. Leaf25 TaxID=1735692 RepID=UPI000700D444|nr:SRPBCC family protein [Sphingomonas sp. Leaf25]KQN04161.1 hypothetical protein ASE78_02440 [Sphingomonas sp. Leaf25]